MKYPKKYEVVNLLRRELVDSEIIKVWGKNMQQGILTMEIDGDLYNVFIVPIQKNRNE